MSMSLKEKAGIVDTLKIYEGLHLSRDFIHNFAMDSENLEPELKEEGERHFNICEKCKTRRDSFLPFELGDK